MKKVLTRVRNATKFRRITKDESTYLILRAKIMEELFSSKDSRIRISTIPHKFRTPEAREVINRLIKSSVLMITYATPVSGNDFVIERVDCFLLKSVAVEYME